MRLLASDDLIIWCGRWLRLVRCRYSGCGGHATLCHAMSGNLIAGAPELLQTLNPTPTLPATSTAYPQHLCAICGTQLPYA
eukprot:1543613-Rhodomonas_salina.1